MKRLAPAVAFVAACAPIVLVVRAVLRVADAFNVPYWDAWELVPRLHAASAGTLRLSTFWTQSVESRPVLPLLALFALARATAWDQRAEVAANLVVTVVTLLVLASLLRRTVGPWRPALVGWLTAAVSLLLFPLARYEAWLWGPSLATVSTALFASVAVWAIAWRGSRWSGAVLAMAAATAAALSFTNGLVLLVLVPVGLLLARRQGAGPAHHAVPLVSAGVGAGVAAVYFTGLTLPGVSPLTAALARPADTAAFFLVYLGAPFAPLSTTVSLAAGALGIVILIAAASPLWRRRPERRAALLPWLLLAGFALAAAGMTAAGRVGFGIDHALASRYQTFSVLFWVTLIVVATLAVVEGARASRAEGMGASGAEGEARVVASRDGARRVARVAVPIVAALAAVIAYAASWRTADELVALRAAALERGRECVVSHDVAPDDCLALLYPDPGVLRRRASQLQALRLGPFAEGRREAPLSSYAIAVDAGPAGVVDQVRVGQMVAVNPVSAVYHSREVVVSGWAIDPSTRHPARRVIVVADGTVVGAVRPGERRPDVARALGDERLLDAGWTTRFGAFRLAPGPHTIGAYAVLDAGTIAPLSRAWTVGAPPLRP